MRTAVLTLTSDPVSKNRGRQPLGSSYHHQVDNRGIVPGSTVGFSRTAESTIPGRDPYYYGYAYEYSCKDESNKTKDIESVQSVHREVLHELSIMYYVQACMCMIQ